MPYTDATLFTTKETLARRMRQSNKPTILAQADINRMRWHADPLYPTESVTGRDDNAFRRDNIVRSQISADRMRTWKNTVADQREERLRRLEERKAAKEREIKELENAWLERERKKAELVNAKYVKYKEQDSDYMRMFQSAKLAASCLESLSATRAARETQAKADHDASVKEKEHILKAYQDEVEGNKKRVEEQRITRVWYDRENDKQIALHRQEHEEEKQERQRELESLRKAQKDSLEYERQETMRVFERNKACRDMLDRQMEERSRIKQLEKLEDQAVDLEIKVIQQKNEERKAIHERKRSEVKKLKEEASETVKQAIAAQVKENNAKRIDAMLRCEGADVTEQRAEQMRRAREEKYRKVAEDARRFNEENAATRFAHKTVEEMADYEYGQKKILENKAEEAYEKALADEKRIAARARAAEMLAEINTKRMAREKAREIERVCDLAAALKDVREAQDLVERCRRMALEEQDPLVRRAYDIVIRNINQRVRTISWQVNQK